MDLRGKFIVLEGLDGAGGSTQADKVASYLLKKGYEIEKLTYPDYKNPIGKLILKMLSDKKFRSEEIEFTGAIQFLLYATDMVKDIDTVREWLAKGKTVIADRYFTSTLAYQGALGFSVKKGLEFAKMFGLVQPDIVVYLKIGTETSMKRKKMENGKLDWFEEDTAFLGKVAAAYEHLVKGNVFGRWVTVDGEKQISDVFEGITKAIDG